MHELPPDTDPLGMIASYILEQEKSEDVIIISISKNPCRINLANASADISFGTEEKQRKHVISLLKFVIQDMEDTTKEKDTSSYIYDPSKLMKSPPPRNTGTDADDGSISVNE
jgi:hypothetical protein